MKELLGKLGGYLALPAVLIFIGFLAGSISMKNQYEENIPKPVIIRDTTWLKADTVTVIRHKPAIIIRDTIRPLPSPAYIAVDDTTISGVYLRVAFFHPEKTFGYKVRPPDVPVITDTVKVPYPVFVETTNWEVIWKVGVAALAVGYIVGDAFND